MITITIEDRGRGRGTWLQAERQDDTTLVTQSKACIRLEGRPADRVPAVNVWDLVRALMDELESVTGAQPAL